MGVSAWVAFQIWQYAPTLSLAWFGKSLPWFTTGLPIVAFSVIFFILRKILQFLTQPFNQSSAPKHRSGLKTLFLLLLAMIPTLLICGIGAAVIRHTASVAELRAQAVKSKGQKKPAPVGMSEQLKTVIDTSLPESWLKFLDLSAEPARLALAKLITEQSINPPIPVIDPETGKPIPRAIIVDEPDLLTLAREGDFGSLLRHPLLTKALADPKIQKILRDLQLK